MSIKVKTKGPFETKAHRLISLKAGEVIVMPDEDYEEVKNLCEVIEPPRVIEPPKKKEKEHGTGKSKVSRNH